jgi:hypothetical protein
MSSHEAAARALNIPVESVQAFLASGEIRISADDDNLIDSISVEIVRNADANGLARSCEKSRGRPTTWASTTSNRYRSVAERRCVRKNWA